MKRTLSMWACCVVALFAQDALAIEGEPLVTIVPTASLSINTLFEDAPSQDIAAEDSGYFYPSLWLGARGIFGTRPGTWWAPSVAVGLELEPHSLWDGRRATYYIPTLQVGATMMPEGTWDLEDLRTATFHPLHVYGSLGVRSRSLTNRAALRLGAGLNAAVLPLGLGVIMELEQDASPRLGIKLSMGF